MHTEKRYKVVMISLEQNEPARLESAKPLVSTPVRGFTGIYAYVHIGGLRELVRLV